MRHWVLSAFGRLGDAPWRHPGVIPALLEALRNKDAAVRSAAAWSVGRMGEAMVPHPEVIPGLLTALHDPVVNVRESAGSALQQLMNTGLRVIGERSETWACRTVASLLKYG